MNRVNSFFRNSILIAFMFLIVALPVRGEVDVVYQTDSPMLNFAVKKLEEALEQIGQKVIHRDLSSANRVGDVFVAAGLNQRKILEGIIDKPLVCTALKEGGFEIGRTSKDKNAIYVLGTDDAGAMYGILDLAEQIQTNKSLESVKSKTSNSKFEFRAIKFNLPWYSYRTNEALTLHTQTCRDLVFWREFLDMMAENRFNVLTLWNMHPFTYMIRPEGYEKASPFSDAELGQWQRFWHELFKMAKERGIETYILNWNIIVSPQFAEAYGVKQENDTSQVVRDYTRKCISQVIDEYEDLTGIGVTQADWMWEMTPRERAEWVEDTFIAGIKDAKREVKFIYRSVRTGSPLEMRRVIDNAGFEEPVWVEVKFNWSHGHSTPKLTMTHADDSGKIDERFWRPKATNFKIAWMIRNEDFFLLRWGQGDFIREHIATNSDDYVGGYFVGSETYIPAKDYFHKANDHVDWKYAFEKQWLYYMLWGRLLYNPQTGDDVFAEAFDRRYGQGIGRKLLKAYYLASKMPLKLASFHAATWDFTLYSEGFLATAQSRGKFDDVSPFISIDELIDHETLDPAYLSIPDHVKNVIGNVKVKDSLITPLDLADELEADAKTALDLVNNVKPKTAAARLECEVADIRAWANLGLYFSQKLRAAVALETYRKTKDKQQQEKAVKFLEKAATHWEALIRVTTHYKEVPSVHLGAETFSWENFRKEVQRDIELAGKN
jgi:hypothetical protein